MLRFSRFQMKLFITITEMNIENLRLFYVRFLGLNIQYFLGQYVQET